jgi:hypothetical protein
MLNDRGPRSGTTDVTNERNRRAFERYDVLGPTVMISTRGQEVEYAVRDISLSGMGLEPFGAHDLKVGGSVSIVLSKTSGIAATVIGKTPRGVHILFDNPDHAEVKAFIRDYTGRMP